MQTEIDSLKQKNSALSWELEQAMAEYASRPKIGMNAMWRRVQKTLEWAKA